MLHCPTTMQHAPTRRPSRSLIWPVLALALSACTGERGAGGGPPPDPGARVYAMACARCHAADGAGDGELAGRLGPIPPLKSARVAAMSDAELVALIEAGRGAMPPHAGRLPPADITAAAAHVRRLNQP